MIADWRAMSLTDRDTHFEFGKNWRDYASTIDQQRIDAAINGVRKLFPEGLAGKTFLDIGCGSGLHSLAALSLGAASVTAIDIDENSVSTTRAVLEKYAPGANWTANIVSVFDAVGTFDVVYSWGVLHHTGDMWRAIENAAKRVAPAGQLAIAIYSATKFDPFWKVEKRIYSRSPRPAQWLARQIFNAGLLARRASLGESITSFIRDRDRGMNYSHDVHDWLGGYPYEAASADEIRAFLSKMGFKKIREFLVPVTRGVFGSGCNEFVFETVEIARLSWRHASN
jgi:cyclopropane fatty-acyl-phospholipid synthase-like methyltransferase